MNQMTWKTIIFVLMLSVVVVGIEFFTHADIDINLGDEGHLWYGMVHTRDGQVPIRDFRSYDPGRYYWAAGWSLIFGKGIIALRIANAIFQAIGLTLGMLAVARVIRSKILLVLIAFMLTIWMFPRHKVYEHAMVLAMIYVGLQLVERPSLLCHWMAGIFVGLIAFIGRNFGAYCFVSFMVLILFFGFRDNLKQLPKRMALWLIGIIVGYLPMIMMLIFVRGFAESFFESVRVLFTPYAPVWPLPVPWPWTVSMGSLSLWLAVKALTTSFLFLIPPIFYLVVGLTVLFRKQIASTPAIRLLAVSVFVGVPLLHHIFVRADIYHLTQSLHPFLIAVLVLPLVVQPRLKKWILPLAVAFILIITCIVPLPIEVDPIVKRLQSRSQNPPPLVKCEVAGDSLWLSPGVANYINGIRQFVRTYVKPDETFLVMPYTPGLYPVIGQACPIWDPFPLFPVDEKHQQEIIRNLADKNVNWVLVDFGGLGDRKKAFPNTHPLVWQYLIKYYIRVPIQNLPKTQILLTQRRSGQKPLSLPRK